MLARTADSDTIAIYGYLLGTATLVLTLTDLGVGAVAAREVAAGRAPAGGALRGALPLQGLTVMLAAGLLVLLTVGFGPGGVPPLAVVLAAAFVAAGGVTALWSEVLRAQGRVVLEGVLQMVAALALVAAGTAVVLTGGDVIWLMAVVLAKEVVLAAVMLALVRPTRETGVPWRVLVGQGLWVAVASTAIVVLWRQGTIVAGAGSTAALAVYVVASRYLDAGVTVAHTVGFGLLPGMSALATEPAALRRSARRYLALAACLGLAVAVVGSLLAPWLVSVPFGPQWEAAVPSVRWIAAAAAPILVSFVLFPVLLARGQVRTLAISGLAALAVGVPVAVALFLPTSDPAGSVIGTAVGALVLAGALLWGARDLVLPRSARDVDEHVEQRAGGEADIQVAAHALAGGVPETLEAGGVGEEVADRARDGGDAALGQDDAGGRADGSPRPVSR
ncbi:hypothetical protein GCM10025875_18330 [Litorihabitans aurantiacus]|uniref:Membrane protein involved in the export of O-antigen and teichoic acid n=1 Tax=Litorihabitans aurantiacus TaxID=1930061 RepID=A0AA38CRE9_9MICO|nr:hypothetical protein GCM10025875_18330 [Litorihabitans aurantiacus]